MSVIALTSGHCVVERLGPEVKKVKNPHLVIWAFSDQCWGDWCVHLIIMFDIPIPHSSPKQTLTASFLQPMTSEISFNHLWMKLLLVAVTVMSCLHALVQLVPTMHRLHQLETQPWVNKVPRAVKQKENGRKLSVVFRDCLNNYQAERVNEFYYKEVWES